MTMDLVGPQGDRAFNNTTWRRLIQLAVQNGWKPAGATCPHDVDEPASDDTEKDQPVQTSWIEEIKEQAEQLPEENRHDLLKMLDEMLADARILAEFPKLNRTFGTPATSSRRMMPEHWVTLWNLHCPTFRITTQSSTRLLKMSAYLEFG